MTSDICRRLTDRVSALMASNGAGWSAPLLAAVESQLLNAELAVGKGGNKAEPVERDGTVPVCQQASTVRPPRDAPGLSTRGGGAGFVPEVSDPLRLSIWRLEPVDLDPRVDSWRNDAGTARRPGGVPAEEAVAERLDIWGLGKCWRCGQGEAENDGCGDPPHCRLSLPWNKRPKRHEGDLILGVASRGAGRRTVRRKTHASPSPGRRRVQNRMDKGKNDAGGETRTPDTRIMIPLL